MSHDRNRHKAGEILILVLFSTTDEITIDWKGKIGLKRKFFDALFLNFAYL
jgi:hypothetical protein